MRPAHPSTHAPLNDPRSAFPWAQPEFHGGERAALAHLAQYCKRGLPHSYKATRNVGKLLADASKQRARFAVLLGAELADGRVMLKDLANGEQRPVALTELPALLRAPA